MKRTAGSQWTEEFKSSSALTRGVVSGTTKSYDIWNKSGSLTVTTGLKTKNTLGGRGIPQICGLPRGLMSWWGWCVVMDDLTSSGPVPPRATHAAHQTRPPHIRNANSGPTFHGRWQATQLKTAQVSRATVVPPWIILNGHHFPWFLVTDNKAYWNYRPTWIWNLLPVRWAVSGTREKWLFPPGSPKVGTRIDTPGAALWTTANAHVSLEWLPHAPRCPGFLLWTWSVGFLEFT